MKTIPGKNNGLVTGLEVLQMLIGVGAVANFKLDLMLIIMYIYVQSVHCIKENIHEKSNIY